MILTKREKALLDFIKERLEIKIKKSNNWGGGTSVEVELKYGEETISKDSYLL